MTHDAQCIFCKIVQGDIPASTIYEDQHVKAFLDISQATKGHTLIIPKNHHENIFDLPEGIAAHLFSVVPKISRALKSAFSLSGINLVNNSGEVAGQTVFHYHLHLLPRYNEEDGFHATWANNSHDYSPTDLMDLSEKLKELLAKE